MSSRWQPGQSGNPKGRPKRGNTMTSALQKILREQDADGLTHREKVARAMVTAAEEGNIAAAKELLERLDGKVEQPQEHSGKDGGPIEVRTIADVFGESE